MKYNSIEIGFICKNNRDINKTVIGVGQTSYKLLSIIIAEKNIIKKINRA
jgi:hypothetical protein